ncbi:NFACT family protein [Facklamia sp. DSM 111018]|uniref:Rqc2 homolog RqcH n=1 Tax=Facklamia lactis TaxID=2749967 RepID=A0ABS0LPC5_9LACT|nr:NFACT RNA binding domain-containing protein [Facklamia lactis]MBG9979970.1 NFACT family protein [Facklamia lactis]MBG9985350.1 NFACT family protein [Facklamia lactis]
MSIDGFFTRALCAELRNQLNKGRIHKIYQPFEQELQLVIRANRTNHRLSASIHPNYFSIYLTDERPANPEHAPMFCMLLRKYLESAFIIDIQQHENDRIIDMRLTGRDEIGVEQEYLLSFELMGRHSNIILVNPTENTIIDCIKHVPSTMNSYRSLTPGSTFKRPPKNTEQHNLYTLTDQELYQFSLKYHDTLASGKAYQVIQGMGKQLSKTIAYWMSDTGEELSAITALERLKSALDYPAPTLYQTDHSVKFYAFDLPHIEGIKIAYSSLSELLFNFYHQKVHLDRIKQLSGNIIQKIEQVIDKNKKKLSNLEKDRAIAKEADTYRIMGELLNAFAYQIPNGQDEITLNNYYQENQEIIIKLNPRLSAVENAQVYFKKYQKYRDALKYIQREEKLAKNEINYLEGILIQLEQADLEDVESIKQELIEEGYVSQKKISSKKRAKTKSKPRRFKSSDGCLIYVGRNNQQNDELSLKKAAKNHWWLHAKEIPGAHVIIESDKPSEQTMLEAAQLAAYYSKFSSSANVPVDTVQAKQLKKPNGAKPGFVIYEGQKTLYVTPDKNLITQLAIDNKKSSTS